MKIHLSFQDFFMNFSKKDALKETSRLCTKCTFKNFRSSIVENSKSCYFDELEKKLIGL